MEKPDTQSLLDDFNRAGDQFFEGDDQGAMYTLCGGKPGAVEQVDVDLLVYRLFAMSFMGSDQLAGLLKSQIKKMDDTERRFHVIVAESIEVDQLPPAMRTATRLAMAQADEDNDQVAALIEAHSVANGVLDGEGLMGVVVELAKKCAETRLQDAPKN